MADGQVIFDTALDESGLNDGLKNIEKTSQKSFLSAGKVIAAGTAAMVVAAAKASLSVGSSFDTAMSQVAATMGTTVDQIGTMSEKAKEMGASTQYTATEAAQALNYLALAGYDAEKATNALGTVLSLAAAGSMDLATASDMVTDAMGALGMEATESNLTAFCDQMAKTASKANTSVSQLGEAILTVGGTANVLSGGATEMNTVLGLLANVGIKGAEGGTHLRNAILSLTAPTKAASKELKKLGVETTDASGNLRDMGDIMSDMSKAYEGMSEAEKTASLSKIFNKTDLTAINGLLSQTGDAWSSLYAEVSDASGAMSAMAATQLDNLGGDVTVFKSAAEGLGIAFYEGFSGEARNVVQFGTGLIDQLSAGMKSGGFEGLSGAFGDVLSQTITGAASKLPSMIDGFSGVMTSLFSGLSKNSSSISKGLSTAISAGISGISKNLPGLLKGLTSLTFDLISGLSAELPSMVSGLVEGVLTSAFELATDFPALLDAGWDMMKSLGTGIWEGLKAIPQTIDDMIMSDFAINKAGVSIQSVEFKKNEEISEKIQEGVQIGIDAATAEKDYSVKVKSVWVDYSELEKDALSDGKISKKEAGKLTKWVDSQVSADIEEAEKYIAEQQEKLKSAGVDLGSAFAEGYNSSNAELETEGVSKIQSLVTELKATQEEYNSLVKTLSQPNYTASAEEIARLEELIAKTQGLQAEIKAAQDAAINYQKGATKSVLAGAGDAKLFGTAIGYEKTVAQQKRDEAQAAFDETVQAIGASAELTDAQIFAANKQAADTLNEATRAIDAEYASKAMELVNGMAKADPKQADEYVQYWEKVKIAAKAQKDTADIIGITYAGNFVGDFAASQSILDYIAPEGVASSDKIKSLIGSDWYKQSEAYTKLISASPDLFAEGFDFGSISEIEITALSMSIAYAYAEAISGIDMSELDMENPLYTYLESAFGEGFDLSEIDISGLETSLAALVGTINFKKIVEENAADGADQSGAVSVGLEFVQKMCEGLDPAPVEEKTTQVVQDGISSGNGAASGASSIGASISAGIASGIRSSTSVVTAAAAAVVRKALAAAKAAGKIASPSRLFADVIGANIAKGVAAGIDENVGDVGRSAESMVRSALPELGSIGKAGIMASHNAESAGAIQQVINFNTEYVTPDVVARTMREFATYGFARG